MAMDKPWQMFGQRGAEAQDSLPSRLRTFNVYERPPRESEGGDGELAAVLSKEGFYLMLRVRGRWVKYDAAGGA